MENSAVKKIKDAVLGRRYDLSVAFVSVPKMRRAMRYKKTRTTKTSGEILICKAAAKPYSVGFLFIHGLLHLKGLRHGVTMEHEEDRLLKRFGLRRNG